MILIASGNIGKTITRYRKVIKGISRCRLTGKMNGVPVRIIPYHLVGPWLEGKVYDDVIFDCCWPTDDEQEKANNVIDASKRFR